MFASTLGWGSPEGQRQCFSEENNEDKRAESASNTHGTEYFYVREERATNLDSYLVYMEFCLQLIYWSWESKIEIDSISVFSNTENQNISFSKNMNFRQFGKLSKY